MLRSSHKVLTLRLGTNGYAVSQSNVRGTWQNWPAAEHDGNIHKSIEERLAALKLNIASCALLDVVLDSTLTRVQVIRFPAGVRKPAERTAFLKAAFRNVFGRDANTWHVIAEPTYVNQPTPAVAIDDKLMQAINTLAERHRLKLLSLRTAFTDAFNSARRNFSAHMGAFALLENGRVSIGLWRHRSWIALSTQALTAADGEGLAALCAQMLSRIDPPMLTGTLYIAGADKPFAVNLSEGWTTQWLQTEGDALSCRFPARKPPEMPS
ncbi:MAG: hypothetical protein JWM03_1988 [Rhodocyclales bacterium]|nr:hypothetical protein [Rhodocyclales bacterium]MDB5889116.1 hypothetical protein [Rhodocyclales bacterium]